MHKHKSRNHVILIWCIVAAFILLLGGCKQKSTEIVLTTDFKENEVFRINKLSCMLPEIKVYLVTARNQCEEAFGNEVWNVKFNNSTLSTQFKESILAKVAQIKAINLLAQERKITLDKEEEKQVKNAAQKYYATLSQEEAQSLLVTEDIIYQMYAEYALANKVYQTLTAEVNTEVSDDEARTITVKQILIKTYEINQAGERIAYTGARKQDAYARCLDLLNRAKTGEDFDALVLDYNEDEKSEYSFAKGVMPEAYDQVAFALSKDEISDIIETEYGYHIIKCVTNLNREETDANKINIVNKRKEAMFNQVYDEFLPTLTSNLNDDLWKSINVDEQDGVTTKTFFDVYNETVISTQPS
ncbi:MAG: peptidylprolyl isomerase [Clostridia bacterium]|mgnify:CR=1 FL=1|nr:peptidylprolyl isomerase [Clostridia bacterium]